MNISAHPELLDHLAASHALGTLRGGARRRFEALARSQPTVRAAALLWQERLASLTEIQRSEVPGEAVWKRIENLVAADLQARAMAEARAQPASAKAETRGWASLAFWRGFGALATVAAVALGVKVVIDADGYAREGARLGEQVSRLQQQLATAPEVRYVAVLQDDQAAATMLVTFDPKNRRLVLKRVGSYQEAADRSLQLWALPQGGKPQSLGVLGREGVVRLTAADRQVRDVPALAISLEPVGGVPSEGGPTGPVLFKGALIEAGN